MPPTAEDSLNMIELYEPNTTGSNASSIQLKAGGVISLIYDGKRKNGSLFPTMEKMRLNMASGTRLATPIICIQEQVVWA